MGFLRRHDRRHHASGQPRSPRRLRRVPCRRRRQALDHPRRTRRRQRRPDGSATITFRRPKTDADTTAYLAPATVTALDATRRGAEGSAPLFGLSASRIKQRITAAARAAGLEGVSSHGCRIGMAQDLARTKGIEMPAIMQAGGWRSETTVARYTARESAARNAVARFYEQQAAP